MGRAQPIVNVSDLFSDPWREVVAYGNVTQHTPLMTPATPLAAAVLYLMLQRPLRALCRRARVRTRDAARRSHPPARAEAARTG